MSLYLDYRPQDFDSIVNQKHIIDILRQQIKNDSINSSYLFFWPRWTWKTSTARILTKAINCSNLKDGNPCNKCENCVSINQDKTLDFVEIDAASHTQVDKIREEILEKAIYPPTMLKKKVYVIDEIHMLSKQSFNALLKTMEEPPSYLTFILATTEVNKIPETIISRTQVFNFKKLSIDDITSRLIEISEKEKFEYDEDAIRLIAKISDGAMRDPIKYLDQISVLWRITLDNVSKFLGVASDRVIEDFVKKIEKWNLSDIYIFLEDLQIGWIDLYSFTKETLQYIDSMFTKNMKLYSSLSDLFRNIIINIKYYPNPLVVYKTELYKYFENKSVDSNIENQKPIIKNTDVKISTKVENKKPITSKSNLKDINLENVLENVKNNIEKISLKSLLSKYVILDSLENGLLNFVVISKLQRDIITRNENIMLLEKLFSDELWLDIKLNIIFMEKEDYMKKQLWI